MDFNEIMMELEALGTERGKKAYLSRGVKEPLFGVATGSMKAILKKVGKNQELANQLYATGNFDAMYLAGMIANTKDMTRDNFAEWMESAYCYMISDHIVAVTLAETDFAQEVADKWIESEHELYQSAGWATYEWLLGNRKDSEFVEEKIEGMLKKIESQINDKPNRVRYAMNNFISAVGVSYIPLTQVAIETSRRIGDIEIFTGIGECQVDMAKEVINNAMIKGRIGFKRKNVRC